MKHWIIALLLAVSVSAHATLTNQTVQNTSAYGNSSTTTFTIGFPFQANSQITVFLEEHSTNPVSVNEVPYGSGGGKYTITGGDPGTTVVMGTAPTSTQKVLIRRSSAVTQTVDYAEESAFPFEDHEEQMDKTVQILQEMKHDLNTKVGLSTLSTYTAPTFPDPVADKFVVYNHAGDDFTLAPSDTPSTNDFLIFNGSAWETYNLNNFATLVGASALNGSGDQVLTMNPAGTAMEFDTLVDANIAGGAAIERGKLAKSTVNTLVFNLEDGSMGASTVLLPANGGTGASSLTEHSVILGGGSGSVTFVDPGTGGNVLTSDGTTWYSAIPGSSSFFYSGYHTSDCSWNTSAQTFTLPSVDTSCFLYQTAKSGFSTVSAYNNGTPGSQYPGIQFTADGSSGYRVCAYVNLTNNSSGYCALQLTDGTTSFSEIGTNFGGTAANIAVCGMLFPTSAGVKTVELKMASNSGAITCYIQTVQAALTKAINWTLERL